MQPLDDMTNREIGIILHNNGEQSIFKVRSLDSISSIFKKFPETQPISFSKLIYNNIILSYAFSFAFYGINEGSHIYAITNTQTMQDDSQPRGIKQDIRNASPSVNKEQLRSVFMKKYGSYFNVEEFECNYKSFQNSSFASEIAKLKDRFYLKIEGTIKCHRRFIKNFFQNAEKSTTTNENCYQCYSNDVNKSNGKQNVDPSAE